MNFSKIKNLNKLYCVCKRLLHDIESSVVSLTKRDGLR